MNISQLPAELVREILDRLDPQSFYMCLQTSKLFRSHALASTRLLHQQLARIPGQRVLPPEIADNAAALVKEFGRRCAQHLYHGMPWSADVHVWRAARSADRRTSKLVAVAEHFRGDSHPPSPDADTTCAYPFLFVEVRATDATVHIYAVEDGGDQDGFAPKLKFTIATYSLSQHLPDVVSDPYAYEVLQVAMMAESRGGDRKIAVLYRNRAGAHGGSLHIEWLKLIIFRLDADFGPLALATFHIDKLKDEEVRAMAITNDFEAVLVTQFNDQRLDGGGGGGRQEQTKIAVYKSAQDQVTLEKRTVSESETIPHLITTGSEYVGDISLHGRTIHISPTAIPLPQWHTYIPGEGDRVVRRDTYLPDSIEPFSKPALGRPLAYYHHHQISDPAINNGLPSCSNTFLELVLSNEESQFGLPTRTGGFLLKAIHYPADPSSCSLPSPATDHRPLDHFYVAHLAGLPDLHNLSTLGLKIAISPLSHRVAVAHWKSILVYALDPGAFLDPSVGLAGTGSGVPDDYHYMQGCAWPYYECEGRWGADCVVLRPVSLPNEAGVVFGLEFRGEDELWGWCDGGLVRWRFGVGARGRRGEAGLESLGWGVQ